MGSFWPRSRGQRMQRVHSSMAAGGGRLPPELVLLRTSADRMAKNRSPHQDAHVTHRDFLSELAPTRMSVEAKMPYFRNSSVTIMHPVPR
jgi:hypothetical protein